MAEAAEAAGGTEAGSQPPNDSARFYCHKCNVQIRPQRPEFTCPRCQGGFIEEMSEATPEHREDFDVWTGVVNRNSRYTPGYLFNQIFTGLFDGVNSEILGNLQGGGFIMPLHGNPGDYAWGHGGLDAVISHLLNQLDGAGPAPLSQQQIDSIPEAKISAEQVKASLQCSVCMDDFTVDEVARRLECGHHFHAPCITPWLQIHATCPICRLQLTTANPDGGAGGAAAAATTNPTSIASATISNSSSNAGDGGTDPSGGRTSSSAGPTTSAMGAAAAAASSTRSPHGGRPSPSTPSTSGVIQRRPAYQEDECD